MVDFRSSRDTLHFFIFAKDAQRSETDFWDHVIFCAVFSFWDMVDYVFNIRIELRVLLIQKHSGSEGEAPHKNGGLSRTEPPKRKNKSEFV